MKKVIKQKSLEEAQYFCDKHPERECFTELKAFGWYGSKYDMSCAEVHLCDECMRRMFKLIEEEFGIKPEEIEI